MDIYGFFGVIFLNCMLLFLWFNTTAFYEYFKILGGASFFEDYEKTPPNITYPEYLFLNREKITKNKGGVFLIKLITCVFCLNFWTTLVLCTLLLSVYFIPGVYINTLFIYGVLKKLYNFS